MRDREFSLEISYLLRTYVEHTVGQEPTATTGYLFSVGGAYGGLEEYHRRRNSVRMHT